MTENQTSPFSIQHVKGGTHTRGHTLDLVISRLSDKLISEDFISDLISDHFAVVTVVRAHQPVVPMKSISFRSTSAIMLDRFESVIAKIPFVVSPSDSLDDLLNQYNTGT